MHLGNTIKILRTVAGLNQGDLAEKINKTRSLVSHIEQTGKVNYYTLQLIAKALNTTVQALEQYSEDNPKSSKQPNINSFSPSINNLTIGMDELKIENQLLKDEILALQKKVILLLEEKKI
jgi:transcriptional regulator with XRE-family HTH domain